MRIYFIRNASGTEVFSGSKQACIAFLAGWRYGYEAGSEQHNISSSAPGSKRVSFRGPFLLRSQTVQVLG